MYYSLNFYCRKTEIDLLFLASDLLGRKPTEDEMSLTVEIWDCPSRNCEVSSSAKASVCDIYVIMVS